MSESSSEREDRFISPAGDAVIVSLGTNLEEQIRLRIANGEDEDAVLTDIASREVDREDQFSNEVPVRLSIDDKLRLAQSLVGRSYAEVEAALRDAGFDPSQERDENGQWTSGGYDHASSSIDSTPSEDISVVPGHKKFWELSQQEYESLPVVHRGGSLDGKHVFVSNNEALAKIHGNGKFQSFRLAPGSKVYPDPEEVGMSADGRLTGFDSLQEGSAIVARESLIPTDYRHVRHAEEYSFASTQINIPEPLRTSILDFPIRPEDIVERELQPHITVKYGLHEGVTASDVAELLQGVGSIRVVLGEVGCFEAEPTEAPPPMLVGTYQRNASSRWASISHYTDRYQALNIPYPNSDTVCRGQCEGTGWIPVYLAEGDSDRSVHGPDEEDPELIKAWHEAELASPTDDGWHFVRCPACGGSGVRGLMRRMLRLAQMGLTESDVRALVFDPDQERDEHGRWFSNSKVVDKEGQPLTVYHGSIYRDIELDPNAPPVRARTGPNGVYFTSDRGSASNYTRKPGESIKTRPGSVVAAHLSLQNPLDITKSVSRYQKKGMSFGEAKKEALKDLKPEHDGIVFKGNSVNPDEYVAFHAHQIRRVIRTAGDVEGHEFHGNQWTASDQLATKLGTTEDWANVSFIHPDGRSMKNRGGHHHQMAGGDENYAKVLKEGTIRNVPEHGVMTATVPTHAQAEKIVSDWKAVRDRNERHSFPTTHHLDVIDVDGNQTLATRVFGERVTADRIRNFVKSVLTPKTLAGANDVVLINVISPDLHSVNALISDHLEHTDTYPDYHPHVTLAYVKAGTGAYYKGLSLFAGQEFTVDSLVFCGTDGEETVVSLRSEVESLKAFDESEHPRDEKGQWSTSGASHDARRKELKLPPAWTDVRINKDHNADLQATGKDKKGRTQYRYSAEHSESAAAEKFDRLKEFNKELPQIRSKVAADLKNKDLSEDLQEAAAVLTLIDKTGFRVGSDTDTGADKQAYGASTLRAEHVKIKGDEVTFTFVGKKGVDIEKVLEDKQLASLLKPRVAAGGRLFDTSDAKVRDYLHSRDGDFKVKDFRTWHGTTTALRAIKDREAPKNKIEYERFRKEVGKVVADHLGNTPTVALASYIDPAVWSPWKAKLMKHE